MMVPPFLNPALTPEQLAVKLATAKLEGWLGAVAQQLSSVTAACEVVLSRDPDAPISHVQQQLLDVEISAAAAARGTPLAAVTDLKDKLPPLAIGRLAQTVGALSEAQPMLVLVDWQWEQFSDCMERMKAWGNNLLDKKLQVQHLVDIRNQLAASQAALSTTQVEVDALQKELVAVKSKAEKLEAKIHEDEAETHRIKLGAAEQEANRSALEVGLSAAREEVASLTSRLTLLEEEYWGAKAKVLEAEMVRGEIMAAKDRAVLAAEEAVAAMKKMESETSQHRIMREKLVLDLIACKAWIRSMGDMDKAHRKLVLDLQEAQDAARKDKQLVFELRSKISNLEDQVQLSAIHTKSSQEQVQALLRDLQAAEAAGGGDSNALAQAHAVAAAEVGRLRVEVSSLVTRVRAAEAAAVSSSRGQEAAKEEAERALSEAKEAADRAWLVEQRMTELRAVVAGTKIHAENIEEQIRHLEGDKEILGLAGSELQAQLAEKETQGVSLQREVWDLSVALHEAEVERKLILEKAVDQKFEPSEEALKNSAVLK
ncbi:hypothetical protein CEUSTIGMA_g11159.t1 [Chlamydomonas eustigma]|uniref:Uncharacterized protein n=1 Tax=Chlamydomonas eustigma TaxID=1157962 RepID=A0A250XKY0_9CHLO|nr:hypothetical protein CEUSTIGMA_g11159.t1 [Chlamydomonas eustigma]|eukprot:GAX83734.1 hypothetical protein CEUSTIGMA_g11159.t1 [Chlamydomonas eustigma]